MAENLKLMSLSTPLHYLAGSSTLAAYYAAQSLLANGQDPNKKNEDGLTPMHVAASWGNYEMLKLLLFNGGDARCHDNDGKTPAATALEEDRTSCFELLTWWLGDAGSKCQTPVSTDTKIPSSDSPLFKNSPIARLYSSPRYFKSPLKDGATSSDKKKKSTSNNDRQVHHQQRHTTNKSWRKIEFANLENQSEYKSGRKMSQGRLFESPLRDETNLLRSNEKIQRQNDNQQALSNLKKSSNRESEYEYGEKIAEDNVSVITKDEEDSSRCRFVEFQNVTPPNAAQESAIKSKKKRSSGTERRRLFELSSCCKNFSTERAEDGNCSGGRLSPPYAPTFSTVTSPSFLNHSIQDVSPSTKNHVTTGDDVINDNDEDFSKIARDLSNLTLVDDDIASADVSIATAVEKIVNESIRRNRSEIQSIDPARLSLCRKLPDSEIRLQLTQLGYDVGPLTNTTRWLYVRRLALALPNGAAKEKYSPELEKLFSDDSNSTEVQEDERDMLAFFENPTKEWREGRLKMSFCYCLLDPTKFSNIPLQDDERFFRTFVDSVFYIGKGKKSRPLQHLIESAKLIGSSVELSSKSRKILQLWDQGQGVISLHLFNNIFPVEAYTREAAMIDAIGLFNLTNIKRGNYYGLAANWTVRKKRRFGASMLKTASAMLLLEGLRPLKLNDVIALQ